jgi:hypothetical protein
MALEDLDYSVDINIAWKVLEKISRNKPKENLRYQRLKCNKPWVYHKCSKEIDQRKQALLQR